VPHLVLAALFPWPSPTDAAFGAASAPWDGGDASAYVLVVAMGSLLAIVSLVVGALVYADRTDRPLRVEHEAAQRRARLLLHEFLSADERAQLERRHHLVVPSRIRPGRVYLVPAEPGLVSVYESGRQTQLLCVRPTVPLPDADMVLAHKLMIECCEDEYLALANRVVRHRYVLGW